MEYGVRYYYNSNELENLLNKIKSFKELNVDIRTYEKTIQYNHSNSEFSFYSKEVDGRYRIRVSKNDLEDKSKISWKRCLKKAEIDEVNSEGVEVSIKYEDMDNLIYMTEKVLKMKPVESYERYRHIFYNDDVEIVVDEYPFGIVSEMESKNFDKAKEVICYWLDKLGLKVEEPYKLSRDDFYTSLCRNQNVEIYKYVKFGLNMLVVR